MTSNTETPVLRIPFVSTNGVCASQIPSVMELNHVEWNRIGRIDWPEAYPYAPKAEFRIAYGEDALLINYRVTEEDTQAVAIADNGRVWEDSCVEMFLSPYPESDIYYNLEANCIGTILLANRGSGREAEHVPTEVLQSIERYSSLAKETTPGASATSGNAITATDAAALPRMEGLNTWTLALKVPFTAFWKDQSQFPPREPMRANFYKCGDKMRRAHFLSWSPISAPKPNFHLPEFFGRILWGE